MPRSPWFELWSPLRRKLARRHRRFVSLHLEALEARWLPASLLPLNPTGSVVEQIGAPGEADLFRIDVPETGRLTAQVKGQGALDTRLSLLDSTDQMLIQSEAQEGSPDDRITMHLLAGSYTLRVEGLRGATGDYELTTDFLPASPPGQPIPTASGNTTMVMGDYNGDGILDLVGASYDTPYVSVLLGLGDGTFQTDQPFEVGYGYGTLAQGKFNADNHLDVVLADPYRNEVVVLLGRGDGTFQDRQHHVVGRGPWKIQVDDWNGDGHLDLTVPNSGEGNVSVLWGRGDGTFPEQTRVPVPGSPYHVAGGDFNRDGLRDMAVARNETDDVVVLLAQGGGAFSDAIRSAVGIGPVDVRAADVNSDGFLDLITTNLGSDDLSVLLGHSDGTFAPEVRHALAERPQGTVVEDLNGDGHLDLAASGSHPAVLLGRGDGTFADAILYPVEDGTTDVLAADFSGDGLVDLACAVFGYRVRILPGRGDGTFPVLGREVVYGDASEPLAADFNGDGRFDLLIDTFNQPTLYLGLGDGTFRPPTSVPLPNPLGEDGTFFDGVHAAADFNGDGLLDVASFDDLLRVRVLAGQGDGSFLPLPPTGQAEPYPWHLITADFDNDGAADLAGPLPDNNEVVVILGRGDGTFHDGVTYEAGRFSTWLTTADFNGDGWLDLATANASAFNRGDVSVLLNRGDGTFHDQTRVSFGEGAGEFAPLEIVTADFDGDDVPDLATANFLSNDVGVFFGRGDGTFAAPIHYPVGEGPIQFVTGDLDGDGCVELVAANFTSLGLSFLRNRGDGSFEEQVLLGEGIDLGAFTRYLQVADVNGDGRSDVLGASGGLTSFVVFLGQGGGAFDDPWHFVTGTSLTATSLAADDVNGDGRTDVVTVNPSFDRASAALGWGDGTFQNPVQQTVGASPLAVITGDFNRDGRADLVTANYTSNTVSVALGLGDGTYHNEVPFAVGSGPAALATGDFNGDGRLDLAVANSGSDDVSLLLGQGDGTFAIGPRLAVGAAPFALLATDLDHDGRTDLVSADYLDSTVTLLLGRGDGTFQPQVQVAAGTAPIALTTGDFDRDGWADLAVANYTTDELSVLLHRPDGTFEAARHLAVGRLPRGLTASDFNSDGFLDLAAANNNSDDVSVLLGRGDGTFQGQVRYPVTTQPSALVAADFNGDGRADLISANQRGEETTVLVGLGDGTFVLPDVLPSGIRTTPMVADLNGDGAADVAVIDRGGDVLLRLGRPGAPATFQAPVVVNPGSPARELAIVNTGAGPLLAALDVRSSTVSFYPRRADGTLTRVAGPVVPGTLPARLTSGDLNNDGRGDLVVVAGGSAEVFVYLQGAAGAFGPEYDYRADVGLLPSDVALADLDGNGWRDVIVTSQYSGDVRVLLNDTQTSFSASLRFRAGTGLYNLTDVAVRSGEVTTALVAGGFNGDGHADLVVVNGGSNRFSLLAGTGTGGLLDPDPAHVFVTEAHPVAVVSGRFDGDDWLDLAVLNEGSDSLSVYRGDGRGGFTPTMMTGLSAGNAPAGLSAFDVNRDGHLDLLVGNEYGDVLTLLGNGDGSFQPYQRAGRHVALAVADLNGDGREDFILGSESLDRLSVSYSQPGQADVWDREDGVLAPGAVGTADLNADGRLDLVLANSGANNVLVFLGEQGGFGAAMRFATGTAPAGVLVQDLNGDGMADLAVANEGSNDVTLFLGQGQGDSWSLAPGPRLNAGAGPVSTATADLTGDGVLDLLVSNQQSNNVFLLPGVGNGFFDDRDPTILTTGLAPGQALVGNFDTLPGLDVVTVNSGSGDLSFFTGADLTAPRTISLGSAAPLVALVGDFDFDGFTDLLVANGSDGEVSLFVADEDGPRLAAQLSHPEVDHPTAMALVDVGSELRVYLTGEGEESAFLLTSFGVLVPGEPGEATDSQEATIQLSSFGILVPSEAGGTQRRPLDGVLVVDGPGVQAGTDILVPAAGEDAPTGVARAAPPDADEQEPSAPSPSKAPFVVPDASRGEGGAGEEVEEEEDQAENAPADEADEKVSPSTRLMLGTEEALRTRRNGLDEADHKGEEVTPAERLAARDRVFRELAEGMPAAPPGETSRPVEADHSPAPAEDEPFAEPADGALPESEGGCGEERTLLSWLNRPATWAPFLLAAGATWVGRRAIRRRLRSLLGKR